MKYSVKLYDKNYYLVKFPNLREKNRFDYLGDKNQY